MLTRRLTLVLALGAAGCGAASIEQPPQFDLTCNVDANQMVSGGVSRDGIPALTNPRTATILPATSVINDDSRVLGVLINGEARAYPFIVLWWHEVINDRLGGAPILVSYCPLTGSGIVFDAVAGGVERNFGVSGLLFENNLVMFDRETNTLWNQMLLSGTCGPDRGVDLDRIPVVETTWGAWRAMHPQSDIVTEETGVQRQYGTYPYFDYDDPDNPTRGFPGSPFSTRRPPKELVLGVFSGTDAVTFPFGLFEDTGNPFSLTNDDLSGTPIVVTFDATSRTAIPYERTVASQVLTFSVPDPQTGSMTDVETGTVWSFKGEAVSGPLAGNRLQMMPDAYVAFWFAWSVYCPQLRLVETLN